MKGHRELKKIFLTLLACTVLSSTLFQIVAQDLPIPSQPKPSAETKSDQQKKTEESGVEAIKINTELVQLDVTVIDQNNSPVYGLNEEDFTVYEDKVKQVISSVNREEVPISFGIVIDTSGSMRAKLQTIADAARDLIKEMRRDDECFITQFKSEAEIVHEFSSDKRVLEDSLGELFTSGGTALLDAIIATCDYAHEKGKRRRKAIVVISDGLERNSAAKEKAVMEAVKENEVQVYLVGFIDDEESISFFRKSPGKKARQLLGRLADDSGGRAFFPKDLGEIPGIAAQIAKDLRTQYVVNYYPKNERLDGTFRSVQVVVHSRNHRKLIARTRQGYYASPNKGNVR
ncbi:MAG: VWA domain-containing protein [Acidobacteria bacterium]|nr:VWA domain-containing protein [Acidobacteriota bacterium]